MHALITEILLFSLYFAFGVSWLAYSPLLKEIEGHFHIDHAQAGLLISSVSLAKAFVPMLAGLLAARIGLRRAVLVGAVLASTAMFSPWAPSFQGLVALRFLFGIGGAILVTLMGAVVMELFSRDQLPLINGLNNVAVNAGITLALFVTVPLTNRIGWQATLLSFGVLSLVLALAWAALGTGQSAVASGPARRGSFKEVFFRRETWFIALAFTGPLSLYLALNTWLPSHLAEAFGLTRAQASGLTGLFNLVGIPTAVCGGLLTSRLGLRRPLIIAAGLLMPGSALGLILSPDPALRTLSALLLGVSFFLYVSPLFTIPMELPGMTSDRMAMLCGVVFSLSYAVSFASPVLVGALRDALGSYAPGLCLFAVTSASLALGGILLPETGRLKGDRSNG